MKKQDLYSKLDYLNENRKYITQELLEISNHFNHEITEVMNGLFK